MSKAWRTWCPALLLALSACTRHLLFVEEDHIGLRAKFEGESPTPAEVHLGYRRGIVVFIPQQSPKAADPQQSPKSTDVSTVTMTQEAGQKTLTIKHDPKELMSLYTVFKANVGFGDPVELHHFLATGAAAANLIADHSELRHLTDGLNSFDKTGEEAPASGGGKKDDATKGGGQ